jgi:hypothetical protein
MITKENILNIFERIINKKRMKIFMINLNNKIKEIIALNLQTILQRQIIMISFR